VLAAGDAIHVTFWSADWTPWRALAALAEHWPGLRFDAQPADCDQHPAGGRLLARTPIARAIIWTRVTARFESRENRHIRTRMEGKGAEIFQTALMERHAHRSIHITGKVPRQSAPKSPAAENIAQITKEVLDHLTRLAEAA
jgi:hypothetical protein